MHLFCLILIRYQKVHILILVLIHKKIDFWLTLSLPRYFSDVNYRGGVFANPPCFFLQIRVFWVNLNNIFQWHFLIWALLHVEIWDFHVKNAKNGHKWVLKSLKMIFFKKFWKIRTPHGQFSRNRHPTWKKKFKIFFQNFFQNFLKMVLRYTKNVKKKKFSQFLL